MQNEKEVYKLILIKKEIRNKGIVMNKNIVVALILLLCFSQTHFAQNYGNWRNVDTMKYKRRAHSSILLNNGNILITGGDKDGKSCEIFDKVSEKWFMAPELNIARSEHNLIQLHNGGVMAIGGFNENTSEILLPDASKWLMADTFSTKRYFGQSTILLESGNVLLIGGALAVSVSSDCQVFDVTKMKWKLTEKLNVPRYFHTTTKLLDGRILVTGGYSGANFTNTCEIYDPSLEKWSLIEPMKEYRANHCALLLKNGKVLVFGGYCSTIELFDPTTNKWATVGNVTAAEVKGTVINNDQHILYIDGPTKFSCGWGLISLKDYSRKYFKLFDSWLYGQSLTKLDENSVLITGGYKIIGGGNYSVTTNETKLYDYKLTGIKKNQHSAVDISELNSVVYPNPYNSTTNLIVYSPISTNSKVELYNILGEKQMEIYNGKLRKGANKFIVSTNNLSSGIYFLTVETEKNVTQIKIINQK